MSRDDGTLSIAREHRSRPPVTAATGTPMARPSPRQRLAVGSPDEWRTTIGWATLDVCASYQTVFDTMRPDANPGSRSTS